MGVAYSAPLKIARPQCLAATHLSSPEVGNGLSWPKPPCTCNAMVTSQAQHSTNEGVLRSNSACSMLMNDDLRLPRRGIEPRPSGFRDIDSTSRPSPLPLGLKFKRSSRTEFRFIIYATSWAGFELQMAGPGRVNKIRAVHVFKSDAVNKRQCKNHKNRKLTIFKQLIFDFTIRIVFCSQNTTDGHIFLLVHYKLTEC